MMSRIGSPVPLWSHQIRASGRLTNGIVSLFTLMCEDRGLSAFRTSAAGVGRPPGGTQGPGVVPARAAWRRSARRLDIPADGTSTRRRPTPHPETRWTALALTYPGGSVDGIGRRQLSHRATRLPTDRSIQQR